MKMTDRRSGQERRATNRNIVSINVEWENDSGRHSGTVSDISESGCYVLSSGELAEGDSVKLFVPIGDGMKAELRGVVKNHVFEIGFALRFVDLSEAQKRVVMDLIKRHKVVA